MVMNVKRNHLCLFLILPLLALRLPGLAQAAFELPKNIQLNAKEDYSKYEQTVIEAAKWLELTEMDKETDKRREIDQFIVKWTTGTPAVNIDIGETLYTLTKGNPELLALYLASYSRYSLENKGSAGKFSATKAGLLSIAAVYKKGISVARNRDMEKLVKLVSADKLDAYIEENFKIPRA